MFDEPTANPSARRATQVLKVIQSLGAELGLTIVLVEQDAGRLLEIGDRAEPLVGGMTRPPGPPMSCFTTLSRPRRTSA